VGLVAKLAAKKGTVDPDIHVAINDHAELRKAILEAAKESVNFLKRHQKLEELRKQKADSFIELRALLKELIQLNMRLERIMPKVKLAKPAIKKEIVREIEIADETVEEPRPKPAPRNKLDELEDELADIESRMGRLR
jgi:hypothetical protein